VAFKAPHHAKRASGTPRTTLPDVIRHTALRSSDFPLSGSRSPGNPASTSQTATIRFDISYPYYKMNLGSKGLDSLPRLCLIAKSKTYRRRRGDTENRRDAEL
jgi:hypothetical protein